ncbi:hypothetical protein MBLNU230_g8615t1 [Neophaeotheca triangularis]
MAAHLSNGATRAQQNGTSTIRDLPKTNSFTRGLPPDPQYPTPASSHSVDRKELGPRMVRSAAYTYVRPEPVENPELLAVSKAALRDLNIDPASVENDPDFKEVVAGNKIITIDGKDQPSDDDVYPWAQCYGGSQFGQWAGQLGDGRAISLFETTNPSTQTRYELQLKGAGRTPYSRFADGKAVLRSSIREFVVSESLHALGIPTTRALSLTLAPESRVRRERMEPGAVVARFAQSWLRLGTFDLARSRGDRDLIRKLADYTATSVYGGWEKLPGALPQTADSKPDLTASPSIDIPSDTTEHSGPMAQNRYTRLYRAVARQNALTVAKWQAYAFTNGVLNTDNTSILGLSIDYGPFAFLDNFDPNYTPNHDDHMLRYAYKNQPSIIWWNLVRLGEDLGELIGAGDRVDDPEFISQGVRQDFTDELIARAHALIDLTGEEYKSTFMNEYKRLMTSRLGLKTCKDSDFDTLYSELLDSLEALELNFNHTFRRLSDLHTEMLDSSDKCEQVATRFFHSEGLSNIAGPEADARKRLGAWLSTWRDRVLEDWGSSAAAEQERCRAMKSVNPKFIPRSWVLDEVIERVEKQGDRQVLDQVMELSLAPFEEGWDESVVAKGEAERWCGDVPRFQRAMQCSCSS